MKKINTLGLSSIMVFMMVNMYSGINLTLIKNTTGINALLAVLLSNIIGLIPLLLFFYISKYKSDLPLNSKINSLFKKTGQIINLLLSLIILTIGITILYNTTNFISSQLLFRTPMLLISIIIIAIAIYHNTKGITSITRVSLILLILNIVLFILSFFSLIPDIKIDNFLPFLKEDTQNIFLNALKLTSINILPIITILIIPKENTNNPKKYTKNIVTAYLTSCLITLLVIIETYGILGNSLIKIYEYPEYIVLNKVILFDFLERIENIISNYWLIGGYIYITIIIYYISSSSSLSKKVNKLFLNIAIGIIIIVLSTIIFKNNTIFYHYIKNIYPYITLSLFLFYLIISLKIFFDKSISKA